MSVFDNAVLNMWQSKYATEGREVEYRRDGESFRIPAIKGQTIHDEYGPDGEATARTVDWICRTRDLVLDGVFRTPKSGDVIEFADEGVRRKYLVSKRAGDRAFRYTDQTQKLTRIYTVEA